jgi:hypothetical protein
MLHDDPELQRCQVNGISIGPYDDVIKMQQRAAIIDRKIQLRIVEESKKKKQ